MPIKVQITQLCCLIIIAVATDTSARQLHKRSTCGAPNTLSQTQKDALLKAHNDYRASEPDATAMWKMTWNEEDAQIAQEFVNQCDNGHGMQTACDGSNLGQNIYFLGADKFENVVDGVADWFSEKSDYTYSDNSCTDVCGHYTQVVWGTSTSIGCAIGECPNHVYNWRLICNYRPAGNFISQKPYTTGTPCTECDSTAVATGFKCVDDRFCAACHPQSDEECSCKDPPDNCQNGSWNSGTCTCDCDSGWYGLLCDRSCTCADKAGYALLCSTYSNLCSNPSYTAFFTETCPKTCNLCPTTPAGLC